jgi:N-acetylglutamate synthase-like GNAT family acetyltransferase
MNPFQVRRATVEDVPQLRSLWEMESLPVETLEKRFTEFQVAENDQGQIVAALGLEIAPAQGRLHGEAIAWPDFADQLRTQLWSRLEVVARNQALIRVWTGLEAPFWKGMGFKKPSGELLGELPTIFEEGPGQWLYLPLRATDAAGEEIDKQIAVLRAMSQAETEQLMERARVMKLIAMGLITIVFAAFAVWVVYYSRLRTRLKRRQNQDW